MTKIKKAIARILTSFILLGHTAPFVYAVTIEGQTPAGTYQQVAVDSAGNLHTTAGGAGTTSTCNRLTFATIVFSSNTGQVLLSSNTLRSQSLAYVEGPADLLLSTQTLVAPGVGPGPWARFLAGSSFSLDTPASVVGNVYAAAGGSASTYTVVSLSTCGG